MGGKMKAKRTRIKKHSSDLKYNEQFYIDNQIIRSCFFISRHERSESFHAGVQHTGKFMKFTDQYMWVNSPEKLVFKKEDIEVGDKFKGLDDNIWEVLYLYNTKCLLGMVKNNQIETIKTFLSNMVEDYTYVGE
jgi:hypothetical protein